MKSNTLITIVHFSISLILTFLVVFLIPFGSKYKAILINYEQTSNQRIFWHDFNHDGNSEQIRIYEHDLISPHIMIFDGSRVVYQWNFPKGKFGRFGLTDCDHNKSDELYIIYFTTDSLILINQIDPFGETFKEVKARKVGVHSTHNGEVDVGGVFEFAIDLNRDNYKEIIYTINAGYTIKPRNIIAWDLLHDTILSSPRSGCGIFYPDNMDIDGDGYIEIFAQTHAFNNCEDLKNCDSLPYADNKAWLMVFNHELDFYFSPVPYGSTHSVLRYIPTFNETDTVIIAMHIAMSGQPSELLLFNTEGTLVKKSLLDASHSYPSAWLENNAAHTVNGFHIIRIDGVIEYFDPDLNLLKKKAIKRFADARPLLIDIDSDGADEKIFISSYFGELIIYRDQFTHPVTLRLENPDITSDISIKKTKGHQDLLCVTYGGQYALFDYKMNLMYYGRFAVYLMIFAAIFYSLRIYSKYLKDLKIIQSSRITQLQIKSISNQLEPHFILNTINSIGALYLLDDKDKADYYFAKFARLIRNTLIESEQITKPLADEIEYVKNYLDIQKFRFDGKFDYAIEIDAEVNQNIDIPKMLVFTFVENAIKHGIKPKVGKGRLKISVAKQGNNNKIFIEDDGIGRKSAGDSPITSTGKGLLILDDILALFDKMNKQKITYEIEDLTDHTGMPSGTKVIINIPIS